MPLYLIKTQLNLTSNILEQNNPKSKYLCKNELIYIRDFEVVQKTRSRVLSRFKTRGKPSSFFNSTTQTLLILIADGAPGKPKGKK